MQCDLVPVSDLSPSSLAAWRRLGESAAAPNPFAEPAFVIPAARAWAIDDLEVLAVREQDLWLAAVPVRRVGSWRSVPGSCLAAWRHLYCYLGTPLVAQADKALLGALVTGALEISSCFALDWIDVEGPVAEALFAALDSESRPVVLEEFERAALYRREPPDYLDKALSRHHRNEYRRKLKRLETEVGSLTLRDVSDDSAAYDRFLELERSGWKGEAGTAMASHPGHGEFFLEVCRGFASSGRFLMLELASDKETVAMRCELLAGDGSFNFKVAFNERFARFSPGIQLYIANLHRFHHSGMRWSDSCADSTNATLNRIWPGRRRLQSVVATRRGAHGTLQYGKWRAAAAALAAKRRAATR
jgi:CelD/BcsL family acetyltransferase involved in cellulose biosynthesis